MPTIKQLDGKNDAHNRTNSWVRQVAACLTLNTDTAGSLEVEELVVELWTRVLMERLADQEGQLVSILARRWHADGTGPIIVKMGKLVCQALHLVWAEAVCVPDDVVVRGCHGALPYRL